LDSFEPPKYVSSLIQSINDAAKTSQTGAIALGALGIYLLAVSISTTDEDLLLGHTTSITQLGVQVSPQITFGIAPWVFVALHAFTLIRYDMLATNLRNLRIELETNVLSSRDRERCRQLLVNIEFIMAVIAPRHSPLHSWLFGLAAGAVLALFPVTILIALQISTLRYQGIAINWVQRGAVLTDLSVLIWFFLRASVSDSGALKVRLHRVRQWTLLLFLPFAIFVALADFAWLNIPAPGDNPDYDFDNPPRYLDWQGVWRQPLDKLLCPETRWGCRYLVVSHQLLVAGELPSPIAKLRNEYGNQAFVDQKNALANVDGAFLRYRTLRFSELNESELYSVDLIDADLTGANLRGAKLIGANLEDADLRDANLRHANLTGANLMSADLTGANLKDANLSGADLVGAKFSDANFYDANLDGAILNNAELNADNLRGSKLRRAELSGASLKNTRLTGADMEKADLRLATLSNANLDGADLTDTDLTGANLSYSNLIGATLNGARMDDSKLIGANLTNASVDGASLSDSTLTGSHMTKASLKGVDLERAILSKCNISGADLTHANLNAADLSDSNLTNATLYFADLEGANMSNDNLREAGVGSSNLANATLTSADFSETDLTETDLEDAWLVNADLSSTSMNNANLKGANLTNANLSWAILSGANLSGADLTGANLSNDMLDEAMYINQACYAATSATIFPARFDKKGKGLVLVDCDGLPVK